MEQCVRKLALCLHKKSIVVASSDTLLAVNISTKENLLLFFRCPAGLPAVNIETKEIILILIFLYFLLILSTLAKLRAPSEQDLLTDCLIDFLSSAALTHEP